MVQTVTDVVADATIRFASGAGVSAGEIYARACREVLVLDTAGTLTPASVTAAMAWLRTHGAPPAAGNVPTGICLYAARRTDDAAVTAAVARAHVERADRLASALRPNELAAVRSLIADALRVAVEFGLEATAPALVARLQLYAMRAGMAGGPSGFAQALASGQAALLTAERSGASDGIVAELVGYARTAARWANAQLAAEETGAQAMAILRSAIDVLRSTGRHDEANALRERLLAMLLREHLLAEAETVLAALQADPRAAHAFERLRPVRADLAIQQDRPSEALELLGPAHAPPPADAETRRYVETIRANALRRLERYDEAAAVMDALIEWMDTVALAPAAPRFWAQQQAHARMTLAVIHAASGSLATADRSFESLFTSLDELAATPDMRLELPTIAAQALWNDGATAHAERWLARAIDARDAIAATFTTPADATGFRAVRSELDVRAARASGRAGRHRLALLRGEAGKAAVLADLLSFAGSVPVSASEVRADLASAIVATSNAEAEAARAMRGLGPGDEERARLAERVIAAQDRRRALTAQLEIRHLQRVGSDRPTRSLDERLTAIVAADGAVVSLTIGVDGIGVAAVGPAGEASRFHSRPTHGELVDAIVTPLVDARKRLTTPGGMVRWQEALGRTLGHLHDTFGRDLRDVLAEVGGALAVLVPHRLLHGLPLPAMCGDDGRTLADDVGPVSLLPALACYDPDAPRRLAHRPALVVGMPDARAPLMALEAHALAKRMTVPPLLGSAAHPIEVAGQAQDSRLVHFAAHGTYRPGLPASSGIQLGAPPDGLGIFGTENGLVSVGAVFGLFDLSGSSLVVLSACESALGDPSVTDDRTGLAGHLLLSGAAQVVASLWSVDDVATLALMEAFYDRLTSSNPAAALRDASAWLRTAPRCVVGERLAALRPLASEVGAIDALNAGIARIGASDESLGPDAWAAFVCYGAPGGRGDQWPDDV